MSKMHSLPETSAVHLGIQDPQQKRKQGKPAMTTVEAQAAVFLATPVTRHTPRKVSRKAKPSATTPAAGQKKTKMKEKKNTP